MNIKLNKSGFSVVEVVVAIAIAVVFFLSIYEIIFFTNRALYLNLRKTEAIYFAQEGIEAVRTMRDNGWAANISVIGSETPYYLSLSGGQWSAGVAPTALINGVYTRTITFYDVERDVSGDISEAGVLDPNTKKVLVNVSWQERSNTHSISLQTYITNFLNN